MKKIVKGVEETEAIRIYVQKDSGRSSGVMWVIKPPQSMKAKFDRDYLKGCWASNEQELIEVIKKITKWKLQEDKVM